MSQSRQALCIIYVSTDDGVTWQPVKPENVPEFVRRPDVMANLIDGEMAQDKSFAVGWYRAEVIRAAGETSQ